MMDSSSTTEENNKFENNNLENNKLEIFEPEQIFPKKYFDEKFCDLPQLFINENSRLTMLNFLRLKFSGGEGKCLFRRWKQLTCKNGPISVIEHVSPEISKYIPNLNDLDFKRANRYAEIKYKYFYGICNPNKIREEPSIIENKPIFLHSNNYDQFDFTINCDVEFYNNKDLCRPITPMPGDLIFIFLSNKTIENYSNTPQNRYINADKWFVASEQFLRAWTAVMYDNHETFYKWFPANTEEINPAILREKFLSGGRLMTNSFRKHYLSCIDNKKEITQSDVKQKFWYLRTEYASCQYVDIYAAIVLLAKYGELPCILNVPNNKDSENRRLSWDLPFNFISNLFNACMKGDISEIKIINYEKWKNFVDSDNIFTNFRFSNAVGFVEIVHDYHLMNNVYSKLDLKPKKPANRATKPYKKRPIQNRKIIAEHYPEIGESNNFFKKEQNTKKFTKKTSFNNAPNAKSGVKQWAKKNENEEKINFVKKNIETLQNPEKGENSIIFKLKIDIPSDWSTVTTGNNG